MDRRTVLAITLCFGIFLAWQKLYIEPRFPQQMRQTNAPTAQATNTRSAGAPQVTVTPAQPTRPSRPAQTVALQTGTGNAVVGDSAQFFTAWNLKSYKLNMGPEASAVNLASLTHQDEGDIQFAFDDPSLAYLTRVQGTLEKTPQGALWKYEDENVTLTREFFAAPDQPFVDLRVTADFKDKKPAFAFLSLTAKSTPNDQEKQDRQLLYFTNNSIERSHLNDVSLTEVRTPVRYVGSTNRYFLLSLIQQPLSPEARALVRPLSSELSQISLVYPVTGNKITLPVRVYFGPKELNLLRSADPTLDHTVDFGWLAAFAYPLLRLLKWFYQFVGNYGVAIILLTLLLKIVTYPLTYKSMKSMKAMAKLQPQLQKIRDKYKDDREALNREMLTLMRSHGYNPMAGCLPILIQMPIFIALYRVLYSSIELYQAPFFLWIHDLSVHDPFYVTPVLLTLTMWIQQKLTPNTATDPVQARMMQLMPLIFGTFMLWLPAGLTIYMLVNALASIVQQAILNRKFDASHVTPVPARAR